MTSLAAALFLLASQEPPPKALDGWKVDVVAKYPQIKHPSVLAFAPDGRLFVGEDPMDMDGPTNKPIDRILCFHPDGKVTVFAENLYAVFGIQYLDGKLYVHHTPKFSVFTDDRGVGKDRVDLIECTNPAPSLNGGGFNDHIPSNCRIAMDGFLYVSVGDKGLYGAQGKDGRTAQIHGGGVFRIRPDGTDLEVFSTGTRNHLDVAINAEDEIFTYDNTDDGHGWWTRVTHMVDGGFYGYPWDYKPRRPYTLWMMDDFKGGSGCASVAYSEDALPAEYHGNLFLSDWARKEVLRLRVARDGGTYRIVSSQKFLSGVPGSEFRPLGLAFSPDGMSLYVCDWNYGGWVAKGKQTGRLIKATYAGGPSRAAPRPTPSTTGELVNDLSHPAASVRLAAQRRLVDRKAAEELEGVLGNGAAPAKWHAIWALDALGGSNAVAAAVRDADPSVRRQALRQLGTRRTPGAAPSILPLLKDGDASVRFHAATALGRIVDPGAIPGLLAALEDPDLYARYAAFTALNRIGRATGAWPEIVRGLEGGSPAVREGTLFALRETYDARLAEALSKVKSPEALLALAEMHRMPAEWNGKWWGTQPVAQPRPAKTVEHAGTKVVLDELRRALSGGSSPLRLAAAQGIAVTRDASFAPALRDRFAAETDIEVRKAVLRALGGLKDRGAAAIVSAAFKDPALLPEAVAAAEQIAGPEMVGTLTELVNAVSAPDLLVPALGALGRLKASAPAVARHAAHADPRVALAAVAALSQTGGEAAVNALLAALGEKRAEVRKAAIAALGTLGARAAVPGLLKAYLDPSTRFEAVTALAQVPDLRALDAYLEGLGGKNAALRELCRKAVGALQGPALPLLEAKMAATLLAPDVVAELQRVYARPVPVADWMILGSFPNPCQEPFPVDAVPPDREFKDARGGPIRWQKAKAGGEHGMVDLRRRMTVPDDAVAYAWASVESPAERSVEFVAGSDDSFVVWLNGERIFEDLRDHGWKWDDFRFRGTLRAGKNLVVVKCGNTGGGWQFSLAYPPPRKGRLFEATPRKLDPKAYAESARKAKGDAARGRALFTDAGGVACVKCHKVGGEGGEVGPDLTGVGAKYAREQFIESILYPSKQILDGYRQTLVLTASGDVRSGRFMSETADELTLMDAEGKRHALRKAEIEQRKESELSLMPEGLNAGLSLQDFADLVAFLESLR